LLGRGWCVKMGGVFIDPCTASAGLFIRASSCEPLARPGEGDLGLGPSLAGGGIGRNRDGEVLDPGECGLYLSPCFTPDGVIRLKKGAPWLKPLLVRREPGWSASRANPQVLKRQGRPYKVTSGSCVSACALSSRAVAAAPRPAAHRLAIVRLQKEKE
jgi:hypothetical protein